MAISNLGRNGDIFKVYYEIPNVTGLMYIYVSATDKLAAEKIVKEYELIDKTAIIKWVDEG